MKNQLFYQQRGKLPNYFNKEEISLIIETFKYSEHYLKNIWGEFQRKRDLTIVLLILNTGLRPKEACWLKFDDIDPIEKTIKIRAETNKQKKERIIALPEQVIRLLAQYLTYPRALFWKGSKYLFPSFQNEKLSPGRLKHRFREILKEAGLYQTEYIDKRGLKRPKFRLYSLRHTHATELYAKTRDIFLVGNTLGHSKLTSTMIYLHTDKTYIEYQRKALNKLYS